jgi:hypothetical protein
VSGANGPAAWAEPGSGSRPIASGQDGWQPTHPVPVPPRQAVGEVHHADDVERRPAVGHAPQDRRLLPVLRVEGWNRFAAESRLVVQLTHALGGAELVGVQQHLLEPRVEVGSKVAGSGQWGGGGRRIVPAGRQGDLFTNAVFADEQFGHVAENGVRVEVPSDGWSRAFERMHLVVRFAPLGPPAQAFTRRQTPASRVSVLRQRTRASAVD